MGASSTEPDQPAADCGFGTAQAVGTRVTTAGNKKVLIVAEHFPPSYAVGGKRPYRFARYLPRFGWDPVLLVQDTPNDHVSDPSLAPLPPSVEVHRNLLPSWLKPKKGNPSDGTAVGPTQQRTAQSPRWQRLARQFDIPLGPRRLLRPLLLARIQKLAQLHRFDAMFFTSSPYYLLDLGIAAKRALGVPAVLDLRDPWSLNFAQKNKAAWVQRAEQQMEERLLSSADAVTVTCKSLREAYATRYPDISRLECIYNSFDAEMRPTRSESLPPKTLDLVHFGNCYGPRKLETVIRALAAVKARNQPNAERLRIINLGRVTQSDVALAEHLGIRSQLHWQPYVPYQEGLQRLSQSALQLLIAYGRETLYIPAKTFDYFLSGRPILALTESAELKQMVEQCGAGVAVKPDAVQRTAELLRQLCTGTPLQAPTATGAERYSAENTASQLAALLNDL